MANGTQAPDVLNDSKFYALPESDQVKILSHYDQKFRSLPQSDQTIILKKRSQDFQLKAKPKTPPPPAAAQEAPDWLNIRNDLKRVKDFFTEPPKPQSGQAPVDATADAKAKEEFAKAHGVEPPKPQAAPAEPVAAHKPVTPPPTTVTERLLANPPGKTEIGPVNPGKWQRIWETVAGPKTWEGKVLRGEQGIPLETPTIDLEALFTNMGYGDTKAAKWADSVRGLARHVSEFTSIPNLEIGAATGGLGEITGGLLGKIGQSVMGRLISAGFGAQMLHGTYQIWPEFKKAIDRGDEKSARDLFIAGALSGYLGVKAFGHAAGIVKDFASKTPESGKGGTQGPPEPSAPQPDPKAPTPGGKETPAAEKRRDLVIREDIDELKRQNPDMTREDIDAIVKMRQERKVDEQAQFEQESGKAPLKASEHIVTGEHNGVPFTTGRTPDAHYGSISVGDRTPSSGGLSWKVLAYQPVLDLPEGEERLAEVGGTADDPWVIIETGADTKQRVALTESGKAPTPGETPLATPPPASPEDPAADLMNRRDALEKELEATKDPARERTLRRQLTEVNRQIEGAAVSEKASTEPPTPWGVNKGFTPPPAPQAAPIPDVKLPHDLAGSKPRYGYKDKLFGLEFENDVDKALYTIAQKKPNKAHDRFMDFLRGVFPGESDEQLKERGNAVKARIKEMAATADPSEGPLTVPGAGPKASEPSSEPPKPSAVLHTKPPIPASVQGVEDWVFDVAKKAKIANVSSKGFRESMKEHVEKKQLDKVVKELWGTEKEGEQEPAPPVAEETGIPTLAGIEIGDNLRISVTDPAAFINSLAAGAAPPAGTVNMPTESLTLSPEEMQFRSEEGLLTRKEERGRIETWNPDLAGAVDVWFDPVDSKIKVVNGHHRTESAIRLKIPSLGVKFIDAPTKQAAHAWGALKNIGENSATPYDAAVFFRATGETPDDLASHGIALTGKVVSKALGLKNLSDELFERVRNRELSDDVGAAIGSSVISHDLQKGLAEIVSREKKRGRALTVDEIKTLAEGRMQRAGETVHTEKTLFGDEVVKESNAVEAARLENWLKKQFSSDKSIFGFVANEKRAKRLGEAGNKLAEEENRRLAQAAATVKDTFTRMLYKTNPVEDAILDGARRIAEGEDEDVVREETYRRVTDAIQKALAGGKGLDEPVSGGVAEGGASAPRGEGPGAGAGAAGGGKEVEPALPGMAPAVEAQKAAAGAEQGRQLTEKLSEAPKSVDAATRKLDTSELFRGTEAVPQKEMFSQPPRPSGAEPSEPSAGLHSAVSDMQASIERMKNEPGAKLENLKAAVEGLPTPESMRQKSFVRALGKLDEAVRSGSAEDMDFYLRKVKDKGRRVLPPMSEEEIQSHIDQVMKAPAPGPGGKTAGPPEVEGSPTEQLTAAIGAARHAARREKPTQPPPLASEAKEPGKTKAYIDATRGLLDRAWGKYSEAAPVGTFTEVKGEWQGDLQHTMSDLHQLEKQVKKALPDKGRRQAMSDWVEANGDQQTLLDRAGKLKGKSRKSYQAAATLTDEEKTDARNFQNAWEDGWQVVHKAGAIEGHVENYVLHLWKRNRLAASRIMAQVTGAILRKDFPYAKHRTVATYFEGEEGNGGMKPMEPVDKDIAFLYATWVRSASKAIAGRRFIFNLLHNYHEDGKPLAVESGGRYILEDKNGKRALIVNPEIAPKDAVSADGRRYREIDHPALRKGMYIGTDSRGTPIFLQSKIIVHPDIYDDLNNTLSHSKFRDPNASWLWRTGGVILDASTFTKQTMLGPFSTFHQVQVGIHAVMHGVNPYNPSKIDWSDPRVVRLVNSGVMVANPDGSVRFEEGLVAGGAWDRIGWGVGDKLGEYKSYLFEDYIPRLKMEMALKALERNRKAYSGKMSEGEIYRLTANEANAAFGELNYVMMGRSKTFQDALRLMMLSPDFTESRARFVGQAFKPRGREQRIALAKGAIGLTITAAAIAGLLKYALKGTGTKVEWNWYHPFSVRIGQWEVDFRSLPGDVLEAYQETRQFMQGRENPLVTKPIDEFVTGKDFRGRPRNFNEKVQDTFYGLVPLSMQGLTQEDRHWWQSALGVAGIRVRKFYSPAGKLALEIHGEDMAAKSRRHETPEMLADRQEVSKLFHSLNDGVPIPTEKIAQLEALGSISGYTAARLRKAKPGDDTFLNVFSSLGIEDKLDVWDKAEDDEREKLRPELTLTRADIRMLHTLPPKESKRVLARYHAAVDKNTKKEGVIDSVEHIFDRMFAPVPGGASAPPVPSSVLEPPRPAGAPTPEA